MSKKKEQVLWVAVKIWRGFPNEVKGFKKRKLAKKQAELWRKEMYPEYDETGVLPMKID